MVSGSLGQKYRIYLYFSNELLDFIRQAVATPISEGCVTPAATTNARLGAASLTCLAKKSSKSQTNAAQLDGGSASPHSIAKPVEVHFNSSCGSREKKASPLCGKYGI